VRARARRLLERLGRGTPQAQVRAGSLAHRARVIRALGDTGDPAAIPALVDVLDGPEAVAEAAARALVTAGPAAIGPLVDALGSPDDAPARSALVRLGRAHPRALRARAAAEGVEVEGRPIPAAVVAELAAVRRATRARALEAEIADAMALGAAGAHRAALARLDEVYAKAPELYMRHADPIARLYVARAEKLLERGDYEAALRVLTDGESVRPLPEIAMRTTDARVALARGFLELGDLERAQEELEAAPVPRRADVLDARRAWLAAAARAALSNGRTGEARRYVDEARRLAPEDLGLRILDRRVALDEHLAVVLAAALGLPALALALGLVVRSRLERRRLERLAAALERQALEEAAAPPS
jgi:tetratricopeptide (TPR) repeat protein